MMYTTEKLLEIAYASKLPSLSVKENDHEWAAFGLHVGIRLYEMVKSFRLSYGDVHVKQKGDGSPSTQLEMRMEQYTLDSLSVFDPEAIFIGEEVGGSELNDSSVLVAIDPIDGTRSFLSGFDTYSITLSITYSRKPLFSLIIAPATGMFAFRIGQERSQMFYYDKESTIRTTVPLPLKAYDTDEPLLLNVHPSVDALAYLERVYDLWYQGQVSLIRSVSGSPSLLMLEAAKTGTYYLNTWSRSVAEPFDLMAAFHIVDGADCKSVRLKGDEIDPWSHKGVYVVGPDTDKLSWLLRFLPNDEFLL